jgi:predicted nucleic acid-binding Zn ribbon protein
MSPARKQPSALGDILAGVLRETGVAARIEQAGIIPEWAALVGAQIAAVTTPQSIAANGTLFVGVTTNAWMMELSMMEPELLRALNRKEGRAPVKKIRWLLQRS